ncbi:unnamed protein product [Amoebophrya sp. A120]|nr:unnamed protein product [Amoebophrya sp. A120]|eukprot:GSA120T00002207001.1
MLEVLKLLFGEEKQTSSLEKLIPAFFRTDAEANAESAHNRAVVATAGAIATATILLAALHRYNFIKAKKTTRNRLEDDNHQNSDSPERKPRKTAWFLTEQLTRVSVRDLGAKLFFRQRDSRQRQSRFSTAETNESPIVFDFKPGTALLAGPAYADPDANNPVAYVPPAGFRVYDFLSKVAFPNPSSDRRNHRLMNDKQAPFFICVDKALAGVELEDEVEAAALYDRFQFRLSWITAVRTLADALDEKQILAFLATGLGFAYDKTKPARVNVWEYVKAMQLAHNYLVLFPSAVEGVADAGDTAATPTATRTQTLPLVRVDLTYDTWGNIKQSLRAGRPHLVLHPDVEARRDMSEVEKQALQLEAIIHEYADRYPTLQPTKEGGLGDNANICLANFVKQNVDNETNASLGTTAPASPTRTSLTRERIPAVAATPPRRPSLMREEFDVPESATSVYGSFVDAAKSTDALTKFRNLSGNKPLKKLGRVLTLREIIYDVVGNFHDIQDYEDKAHYLAAASTDGERQAVINVLRGVEWGEFFGVLKTIAKNKTTGRAEPIERVKMIRELFAKHVTDDRDEKRRRLERMSKHGATHSCISFICKLVHALEPPMATSSDK